MPSKLAKRVAGTFVEDRARPETPLLAWVQEQLRAGSLRPAVEAFCLEQPENLDPSLAVVEDVNKERILGYVPCRYRDHESPATFEGQVLFSLAGGRCFRLGL